MQDLAACASIDPDVLLFHYQEKVL